MRVLVAGCGYVGTELARRLGEAGHDVVGIRRSPSRSDEGPFRVVRADLSRADDLRAALPAALDVVVYAAAADGASEDAYRTAYVDAPRVLLAELARRSERPRVLFTSSTGVYAQGDGEWVDEASPTEPAHPSGMLLLEGERVFGDYPGSAVVLRLGGIYGPGRTRLVDQVREGKLARSGTDRWGNRIHRDDAATALAHLALLSAPAPVYVGVDHEPARLDDVITFLAAELGVPLPEVASAREDGRAARSNKRCRSAALREAGFRFTYPTYREGYRAVIRGA